MKKILYAIRDFLSEQFNLNEDKADEKLIVETIGRDVHFRGTNIWTLIFAIFIASIGLNVNSTAVVIGAMLISPLMGPIMGIGLSVGIFDFQLLQKSVRNLLIAATISVVTSTLYFTVTPLHDASSELLARTSPSLWDVLIAFFGGFAGIIAGTRKEKSNVIPGVAIATALMPPLCTAGYGIANGKWEYFFGAFYLFFINCLFICLATFLVVKHLKFHKKEFASRETEKRVSRFILVIVSLTLLPSIYLTYRLVQRIIFENNAETFVKTEFHLARSQVITRNYTFDGKRHLIDILLMGEPLSDAFLDSTRKRMPEYGLKETDLVVHQGLDSKQQIDFSAIRASILEDVFAAEHAADTAEADNNEPVDISLQIKNELRALYPTLKRYSATQSIIVTADTTNTVDTATIFIGQFKPSLSGKEKAKLGAWLKERLAVSKVKCIFE